MAGSSILNPNMIIPILNLPYISLKGTSNPFKGALKLLYSQDLGIWLRVVLRAGDSAAEEFMGSHGWALALCNGGSPGPLGMSDGSVLWASIWYMVCNWYVSGPC